jgi:hypothetical protein
MKIQEVIDSFRTKGRRAAIELVLNVVTLSSESSMTSTDASSTTSKVNAIIKNFQSLNKRVSKPDGLEKLNSFLNEDVTLPIKCTVKRTCLSSQPDCGKFQKEKEKFLKL